MIVTAHRAKFYILAPLQKKSETFKSHVMTDGWTDEILGASNSPQGIDVENRTFSMVNLV
jgi:hypothetical protein